MQLSFQQFLGKKHAAIGINQWQHGIVGMFPLGEKVT